MKNSKLIYAGLILLATPLCAQVVDNTGSQPVPAMAGMDRNSEANDDRMVTPPPVSGQAYATALTSEERSNYLRGGISFTSAYSDNALEDANGHPLSDISYSLAPMIALDESTSRLHWVLSYAPGFTFYQRTSSRNEADQNASISFQYRLSPHVTFSARDDFQKSASAFNQTDIAAAGTVAAGAQGANFSVIAPIADRLANSGNVGITYQYSLNSMVGASGTFSNLHYPNQGEVAGLSDSASQGGSAFYSLRASKMNYFGATYQYQRLLSYPTGGSNETRTQAILLYYTVYPTPRFSISVYGGPQYSNTFQSSSLPPATAWNPAIGASLGWQSRWNSVALGYSHIISGGGGLTGAVEMDSGNASVRQRITKMLTGSLTGAYAQNKVLQGSASQGNNGHTVLGSASLEQQIGRRVSLQLGYTRVHQIYSNVAVISANPNTNREFVSLSYQFSRPLGR
jgi:hypothetical protein